MADTQSTEHTAVDGAEDLGGRARSRKRRARRRRAAQAGKPDRPMVASPRMLLHYLIEDGTNALVGPERRSTRLVLAVTGVAALIAIGIVILQIFSMR